MAQRLHLVFGGELIDPTQNVFKDMNDIHLVGMYPDYQSAFDAWKSEAQRTVDNAHMRYFIAHIHRLRDEKTESSATEELGFPVHIESQFTAFRFAQTRIATPFV